MMRRIQMTPFLFYLYYRADIYVAEAIASSMNDAVRGSVNVRVFKDCPNLGQSRLDDLKSSHARLDGKGEFRYLTMDLGGVHLSVESFTAAGRCGRSGWLCRKEASRFRRSHAEGTSQGRRSRLVLP